MEQSPLVSIVCLSYFHKKFVDRALRSVINQSYPNIEIIFIDNHSEDNTFEKGKLILEASVRPHFCHQTAENLGIGGGINLGIQKFAAGKYIGVISCDDFWDIYNIEEKVSYFELNEEIGMLYGNGYNYFDDTKVMRLYYDKPSISGFILRELLQAPPINPVGVLYSHKVLKEMGFFDIHAKVEDRDLWYRIAEKYPIGYLHEPLVFYRIHGNNISRNIEYMREGNEYFFKKYEKKYPREIKIARMKQEKFFAFSLSRESPTLKSFLKILGNYKFNWLYTKEVIRSFLRIISARF